MCDDDEGYKRIIMMMMAAKYDDGDDDDEIHLASRRFNIIKSSSSPYLRREQGLKDGDHR